MTFGGIEPPNNDAEVLDALFSKVKDGKKFLVDHLTNHLNWKMTPQKHIHFRELLEETNCFTSTPYSNISANPVFTIKPEIYNNIIKAGSYSSYIKSKSNYVEYIDKLDLILNYLKNNYKSNGEIISRENFEKGTGISIDDPAILYLVKEKGYIENTKSSINLTPLGYNQMSLTHSIDKTKVYKEPTIVHNETHYHGDVVNARGDISGKGIDKPEKNDKKSFWGKDWVKAIIYPSIVALLAWGANLLYSKLFKQNEPPLQHLESKRQLK
jgi:hypothetical protein